MERHQRAAYSRICVWFPIARRSGMFTSICRHEGLREVLALLLQCLQVGKLVECPMESLQLHVSWVRGICQILYGLC